MAATLIQSPEPLSFSLNPVVVKIAGSNWLSAAGVKAINACTFAGVIAGGDTITLKWGTFNLPFLAVEVPDDSGLSFPTGDGSAAYVESLLPYFRVNYLIARDFEVTRTGMALIFTARETGSLYNFTPQISGNISASLSTAGITQAIQPNYGNFIEIWMETADETSFEKIHEKKIELDFPYDGSSRYDISGILHSHLDFERSSLTGTAMLRCTSSRRRFYLKIAEIYGVIPAKRALTQSEDFTVIMGGLSIKGQQSQTAAGALNPVPADATQRKFLKNDGGSKTVRINQPEFIHYISHAAHAILTMQIMAYFTDGTTASSSKVLAGVELYDKIELPATASLIIAAGAKTLSKYEIWLEVSGSRVSEIRTYTLDYSNKAYLRFFTYKSSLGAMDTRMLYGRGSNELEIFQQTAERGSLVTRTLAQGERIDHSVEVQDSFTVATGFMSQANLLRMRDFYASDEKFLVKNNLYLGISVTSKKVDELEDGKGLFSQKFEYQYRFKDRLFTDGDGDVADVLVPPVYATLYYGPSASIPATEAAVKALPYTLPENNTLIGLPTGLNKIFTIAMPDIYSILDVMDPVTEENLTSEYIPVIISIDGQNYKVYSMNMALAYVVNHTHLIKIQNG